jgi:adenylate cyclase
MAKLSYRDAHGALRECDVKQSATIGRHPNQTIQLLDRVVSKAHAVVRREPDGTFAVHDGGSRNGTYLNGDLVQGTRPLEHGDKISIGSTDLFFYAEDEAAAQAGPLSRAPTPTPRLGSPGAAGVVGGVGGAPPQGMPTQRVTIHAGAMETHIRSRVTSLGADRFLPETNVADAAALRRDYEKLRISHELNQSIGLEMDQEVLLDKILEKAFEIVPADRGVILLRSSAATDNSLDPDTLEAKAVKARGGATADLDNVRISRTILKEILEEKQAVLSSDAMMDSRFSKSHSIVLEQIRSTMSVPLMHEDRVLGVVHLDSRIARGAFTEKDLQILTGFARQAAMMIEHNRLLDRMREEIVAREHLDRLLSPQLVEEVLSGRLELKQGGELRRATVVFADIRSFTTISEQMNPQGVVGMLNAYFELMVDIIFKYNGTLDKFVGDEIMAIWGAPIASETDTAGAVLAALEMQEVIERFNVERGERGEPTIHMGIGLNTGEVVAGYIGSTRAMSYTVIGDTVNTAARFCSAAEPDEVLIGEGTWDEVGHLFVCEKLPPTKLKGKLEHVDIYRVSGLTEQGRQLHAQFQ